MRFALDSDSGVAGFARPRADCLYTKNYMKSSGGDLVENGCFLKVKLANVGRIFGFLMKVGNLRGATLQKMVVF